MIHYSTFQWDLWRLKYKEQIFCWRGNKCEKLRSCQKSRKMWLDKCVHKLSADRLSMLKNNLFPELTISLLQQFSGIKTSLFYIVCSENFYSPVPSTMVNSVDELLLTKVVRQLSFNLDPDNFDLVKSGHRQTNCFTDCKSENMIALTTYSRFSCANIF